LRRWRNVAMRSCLLAATLAIALSFFLAFLELAYLTNLLTIRATENAINIYDWYLIGFDAYFILAIVAGVAVLSGFVERVVGYRTAVRALMYVPGGMVIVSVMLIYMVPVLRSVLAVMPLLGLSLAVYSIAWWPYSGVLQDGLARLRRLMMILSLSFVGLVAAFELGVHYNRWLGAVVVFPGLVFIGILIATEAMRVRDSMQRTMNPADGYPADPGLPMELSAMNGRLGSPRRPGRWPDRSVALCILSIAVMVPFAVLATSPARLDIVYATSGGQGLNVTIVNRGGQPAGPVELWGDGELLTTIDRIDAFGVWESRGLHGTPRTLVAKAHGGGVVSQSVFFPESACDTIWVALAVLAAGAALPGLRKRR